MDSTETQLLPKGENEVTQSLRPNENEDELKAAVVNMFVMIFPKKSESLALFFGLFLLIMKKNFSWPSTTAGELGQSPSH